VTSCVSYKPQHLGEWERQIHTENPYYTVYLLGDAGNATFGEDNLVFVHLKNELNNESDQSAIVWLGDKIYPVGLAPNNSLYHKDGRQKLEAQLNKMTGFKGKTYFIPGNQDWYVFGRIGLRRQKC